MMIEDSCCAFNQKYFSCDDFLGTRLAACAGKFSARSHRYCGLRVCAWVEHALELAIEGIVLVVPRSHQIQVPALICLAP